MTAPARCYAMTLRARRHVDPPTGKIFCCLSIAERAAGQELAVSYPVPEAWTALCINPSGLPARGKFHCTAGRRKISQSMRALRRDEGTVLAKVPIVGA